MTTQIRDSFLYRDREFKILAAENGLLLFQPNEYDLTMGGGISSNCWRGYVCQYRIVENHVQLARLEIELDGHAPFCGQDPVIQQSYPHYVYPHLELNVCCNGGLLIGRGTTNLLASMLLCSHLASESEFPNDPDSFQALSRHPALFGESVCELVFCEGELAKANDLTPDITLLDRLLSNQILHFDGADDDSKARELAVTKSLLELTLSKLSREYSSYSESIAW